jgi:hypothetical protein
MSNRFINRSIDAPAQDRREHARLILTRPCKIYHIASRRYLPGFTSDVSDGGSLIAVKSDRPLVIGDVVDVAIGWERGAVIAAGDMVRAKVVRISDLPSSGQAVALRYEPRAAASTATRIAA